MGSLFYTMFDTNFEIPKEGSPQMTFSVGPSAPSGTELGGMFGLSFSAIAALAAATLAF